MLGQVAWATKPFNEQRLRVIGMMHLRFWISTLSARFFLYDTTSKVDSGITSGVIFEALPFIHRMKAAPQARIDGMIIIGERVSVFAEAILFCFDLLAQIRNTRNRKSLGQVSHTPFMPLWNPARTDFTFCHG